VTRKKVILITGPTASGKTAIAIDIARRSGTQIISADSRQCFREMNIGVAKPSARELAAVKHYFIGSYSIHDTVNAGTFEAYALNAAAEIFKHNDIAVMAGGTGLYIKAFCEGLDEIPVASDELRNYIANNYEEKGIGWLREEVLFHDPLYYSDGEIHNPMRLMRALEVKLGTGKSIKDFQQHKKVQRDFDIVKFATDVPRPQLNTNINSRVDEMIDKGLVNEVRSLLPFRKLNALNTVGYSELFKYLDGSMSLEEAVGQIKINTRHYAKRQMTWFRKDPAITWIKNESEIKI